MSWPRLIDSATLYKDLQGRIAAVVRTYEGVR